MYPRGSNGAGQAILDARFLAGRHQGPGRHASRRCRQYEAVRNRRPAKVVLTNRSDPPDAILREVWQPRAGQRFQRIEDVISPTELAAISDRYKNRGLRPRDPQGRGRATSRQLATGG